ncbi:MAG TPA: NAD(P)/FAD-dependent oxidoreductase [Solirubrobacteraceae bacterium]|nr:NAD(P)/FAD-dependent oxidoreductase [Solirubrobacteraceae bacterium]
MSKIVVLGGGVCGLAAGILLRRDGHDVTVLERDSDPVPSSPEEAWERWSRDSVSQFRLAHYMTPRGRMVLEQALPDVLAGLEAAGGAAFDPVPLMPPSITDRTPRAGDDRFRTLTARRPVFEQVLAGAADAEPGLEIRRGVTVAGLVTRAGNGKPPHVSGVRTDTGEQLDADLVVDAMGRRSQLPRWLEAAGTRPVHEEAEDSGFIYYGRFFRAAGAGMPDYRAPLLMPIGGFSLLTLPSDNNTWSVTVYTSAGDRPLKRLRDVGPWTALVRACPLHAHWLEGEPISDMVALGGILDRYRRLIVDGKPMATGVALLGDASTCTNPSLGRGMTLGLLHALRLAETVHAHLDDPDDFAEAWDAVTEAELTPWYRETVEEDRARLNEMEALRHGLQAAPEPGSMPWLQGALLAAVPQDPDAFRAFLANRCCLSLNREIFEDTGLMERVFDLARGSERPPLAGPDRDQLLALIDSAPATA